jgi:hypothetical protein
LYASPDIIGTIKSRKMRWAGHVASRVREIRNSYKILLGKPEWRTPFEDLKQVGRLDGEDWIYLAKYRERWRT